MGAATAFTAASIGMAQPDLKRVVAYSTCSQLGSMLAGCCSIGSCSVQACSSGPSFGDAVETAQVCGGVNVAIGADSWCVLMPRKLASGCTGSNRLGQFDRTLHRHVNSSGLAPETVNRS